MASNEFYNNFISYNTAWLPLLRVLWIVLLLSVVLVLIQPNRQTNRLVKIVLAVIFLWMGVVFFPFYMTMVALPGTITSLGVGILFALDSFRDRIAIRLPKQGWLRYVTLLLVVWSLGLYTLAGFLTGHPYPQSPLPVAPCPMTILSIALISTSMETLKKDRWAFTVLFALLIFWGFFSGLGVPFMYGFYVDFTLFLAGIYGLIMVVRHWKDTNPAL
jgi:hypothetical protein